MGKRSDFKRVERDFYPTPIEAVQPLIPHLPDGATFIEPCAGDGRLVSHLAKFGHYCTRAMDIEPRGLWIECVDSLTCEISHWEADYIITNPPWDRKILHPMIDKFRLALPTWLLFDADWMHTKQSSEHMKYCSMVVSVGRVKWIPDSKMTGKDNCAWHLFIKDECQTVFVGR